MSFFDSIFGGGSSNSAPTMDYSGANNATTGAIATENGNRDTQQAWAQGEHQRNQAINSGVVNADVGTQGSQNAFAGDLQNEYKTLVQPEYRQLVDDANSYASGPRKDLNIGAAQAGVAQNFEQQRNNAQRDLESYGVSPDSTRFAALDIGTRTQQAAAAAAAGTQAGLQTDATGRALRSEALNQGNYLPGQAAGTLNTGLQAGSGAVNADLATTASGANTMGTGTQWASLGNNAIGMYGSNLNNQARNNTDAWSATQKYGGSGLGTALGMLNSGFSSNGSGGQGGLGNLASTAMGFFVADGGAIPEMDPPAKQASQGDGPYNPAHFYAIPLNGGPKGRMTPQEAIQHFHQTKRHVGVFNNHHEAFTAFGHGSDDPQRQDYEKLAGGGAAGGDQTPGGAIPVGASPSAGGAIDDVPARLTAGEFVIPKDVASWFGEKHFQGMIQKGREDKAKAQAKPKMGSAPAQNPAFTSRPGQGAGAIPMGAQ
jgi:hypothetical protein